MVQLLIKHKADTNLQNLYDPTPLHKVCLNRQVAIIKILLQNQAPNTQDLDDSTPLICASIAGQSDQPWLEILQLLLQYGADLTPKDTRSKPSLHMACKNGQVNTVEFLLQQEVDPNMPNNNGNTPLISALQSKKSQEP